MIVYDENLKRENLNVVVKDAEVPTDDNPNLQDVAKENENKCYRKETQYWSKSAQVDVLNFYVVEETVDHLKVTDSITANEDGHLGEQCRQDAEEDDHEDSFLWPVLEILEVELLKISEHTDHCQGGEHYASQVGSDQHEHTGYWEVLGKLNS